jgi:putative RecB family exonuclease
MRTSYSALNTYRQCPQKFKFQEIERIRVPKGLEAVFGNIVHNCLKFMFERSPLYPTLDEVIGRFGNLWQQKDIKIQPASRQGGPASRQGGPEEEKAYYEEGVSILKNFYRRNQPWNFDVVDLESRFEVLISDSPADESHILTGIIDRIDKTSDDGVYEIIDYKTSRRMPAQETLDNDLQMSIYHLGILKRWPHIKPENVKLSLYFLKHGEKITTSRSQEDSEKTKNSIIEVVKEIKERIDKDDFPAFPSPLCGWCGYQKMCPMWKHQFQKSVQPALANQNDVEKIIKEYFELKNQNQQNNKRLAQIQADVYEFMNQEGVERVFADSGYLTRVLQERLNYDMEKIKQILSELGRWNEVVKKKQFPALKASKKKPGA